MWAHRSPVFTPTGCLLLFLHIGRSIDQVKVSLCEKSCIQAYRILRLTHAAGNLALQVVAGVLLLPVRLPLHTRLGRESGD